MAHKIYLLIFSDSSRGRIITGFDKKASNEYWDREKYLMCTEEVYNYVSSLGKEVDLGIGYLKTSLDYKEIKEISQLEREENKFSDDELLDTYKKSTILKAKRVLDSRLLNDVFILDFYNYLMCKEELEYNGYSVNKNTEDSVYKEIILTDNEALIACMETYMQAKKQMEKKRSWYNIFRNFEIQLNKCQSKEEIEEVYNEYTEKFY